MPDPLTGKARKHVDIQRVLCFIDAYDAWEHAADMHMSYATVQHLYDEKNALRTAAQDAIIRLKHAHGMSSSTTLDPHGA